MKIRRVVHNNRRKGFQVSTPSASYWFPYAKLQIRPTSGDPVVSVCADKELGREGFTYALKSGREGTVHIDHVLDYNKDPAYLRDLLLHKLSLEAQERIKKSGVSRREIIRRLGTSPAQLYRLLDQTNYRKSIDQVLTLLHVLDCDVDLVVRSKSA